MPIHEKTAHARSTTSKESLAAMVLLGEQAEQLVHRRPTGHIPAAAGSVAEVVDGAPAPCVDIVDGVEHELGQPLRQVAAAPRHTGVTQRLGTGLRVSLLRLGDAVSNFVRVMSRFTPCAHTH